MKRIIRRVVMLYIKRKEYGFRHKSNQENLGQAGSERNSENNA